MLVDCIHACIYISANYSSAWRPVYPELFPLREIMTENPKAEIKNRIYSFCHLDVCLALMGDFFSLGVIVV